MTLTTPYQASFYVGDGETKAFPFTFEELSDNFIKVTVLHIDGTTSIPTYIVDLDLKQVVFGDETPAPTADDVVCIYRETPTIQDTPFKTLEGYNAKALENILSKIVAMIQEIKSNYFSTQVLQGDPWQLDLLSSADDGATVNIDYVAKKLVKGLYFRITSGNLQVSADGSNYITMPKSDDITEFRQVQIELPDHTYQYKLQYRVGSTWFDAEANAQYTADAAYSLASTVQADLSAHTNNLNNPHQTNLSNLTDVDISNLVTGQFIMFDGIKWKNVSSSATASWGTLIGNITDQTDLMNKFTEYVRTDGSSIMTNLLMMRATEDFKCAIAPYWDGVGFFKLNDNNSVTLMASIEYNSGFEPATTNTYNIGASARKWKNLYLSGKAYMSVINNGYDIAVPVTNSADTLALKSQVDLAANSGSQLYTTGIWYAKMYSASTVPTGAEYDGRNYADFSQVDNDNNPIIVIYEGQSGAWVEIDRITPPAAYNGYVTITSKIWDIAEQTDQQGGEVLWSYNQKTFTPYPKIVSVASCANTDLSNLTATGANIANWSSNVTNCITEIPQDIKLELNAGTLTLKAGSKVYVPNGAGVFDTITIASDLTIPAWANNAQGMLSIKPSTSDIWVSLMNQQYSGSTIPTSSQYELWYDTDSNKVKTTSNTGSTWTDGYSLPIALITSNGSYWTSIDQVFNGFGYIGSTVFALPGVKGLIPNGRNADGSLKNTESVTTSVITGSFYSGPTNSRWVIWFNNNISTFNETDFYYDAVSNYIRQTSNNKDVSLLFAGRAFAQPNTTQITKLEFKQPFHAVDYNEADFVVAFQAPTAENNYTWYRKYKSGWVEMGGHITPQDNNAISITYPVSLTTAKIPTVNTSSTYTGDIFIYVQQVLTVSTTGFTCRGKAVGTNGITAWENHSFDWEVKGMAQG